MYACVTAYPYVRYIHVVLSETKKRGNESSRTELLAVVNYHIGAGTETESSTGAASDLTTEPSCQPQVSFLN